jgi:CubicO group peptidase (beta-lactamase class C family)
MFDTESLTGSHDSTALAAVAGSFDEKNLPFADHKSFSYSNPSWVVMGRVVEQLASKEHADAVQEELLSPLAMATSTFRPTVAMTFPLAVGHTVDRGSLSVSRPMPDNASDWPAGFLMETPEEAAHFVIAFMNGGFFRRKAVLSPSIISKMSTPYVEVPESFDEPAGYYREAHYGYGLFVLRRSGRTLLQYGGVAGGYGSFLAMVRELKVGVVVLTNRHFALFGKVAAVALELLGAGDIGRPQPPQSVHNCRDRSSLNTTARTETAPTCWSSRRGRMISWFAATASRARRVG